MTGARRRAARWVAALAAMLPCVSGCDRPRTQIVVRVEATAETRARVRSVHVLARRESVGARAIVARCFDVAPGAPTALLGEVGLTPSDPESSLPVRVTVGVHEQACVDAGAQGAPLLTQEALVSFDMGRTTVLVLPFSLRCIGARCAAEETCRDDPMGFACAPVRRARLDDYQPPDATAPRDVGGDTSVDVTDTATSPDGAADTDVPGDTDVMADDVALDALDAPSKDAPTDLPVREGDAPPDGVAPDGGEDAADDVGLDADVGPDVGEDVGVDVAVDIREDASDVTVGIDRPEACPAGMAMCAAACVDTSSDAAHCGACDRACTGGRSCVGGACVGGAGALEQRSCPMTTEQGCGMVAVPGGTFTMGEATTAYYASPVQPNTRVSNFALDAYEVTVARFRRWVAAGFPAPRGPVMYRGGAMPSEWEFAATTVPELSCGTTPNYPRTDRENHPMNCVSWGTAQAFCVWDGGRLPTQAEWEFAARGSGGRVYPWGSASPDNSRLCFSGAGTLRSSTCPVGMFAPGAVGGIHDLAGNVFEWNADWHMAYEASGTDCWAGSGSIDAICRNGFRGFHVFRGGSWGDASEPHLRSASRYGGGASPLGTIGFRCARDMP